MTQQGRVGIGRRMLPFTAQLLMLVELLAIRLTALPSPPYLARMHRTRVFEAFSLIYSHSEPLRKGLRDLHFTRVPWRRPCSREGQQWSLT